MKRSIIMRTIAVLTAAIVLAGCATLDEGVLSSIGVDSITESSVSDAEETSGNIDDS